MLSKGIGEPVVEEHSGDGKFLGDVGQIVFAEPTALGDFTCLKVYLA